MTMSDPIADMLTRIRNANTAKHDTVEIPASKMKTAIAEILLKEGFIKAYDIKEEGSFSTIVITLKSRFFSALRSSISAKPAKQIEHQDAHILI